VFIWRVTAKAVLSDSVSWTWWCCSSRW